MVGGGGRRDGRPGAHDDAFGRQPFRSLSLIPLFLFAGTWVLDPASVSVEPFYAQVLFRWLKGTHPYAYHTVPSPITRPRSIPMSEIGEPTSDIYDISADCRFGASSLSWQGNKTGPRRPEPEFDLVVQPVGRLAAWHASAGTARTRPFLFGLYLGIAPKANEPYFSRRSCLDPPGQPLSAAA